MLSLKNKSEIRIAFILLLESNWKYDSVYKIFENQKGFLPTVIICPFVTYGENKMQMELLKAEEFCRQKGYNFFSTWDDKNGIWKDFKKILSPDIVFFSSPHNHSKKEYCINNFLDTLTCYVPYSIRTDNLTQLQFNGDFHQLIWINFYETDIHKKIAEKFADNKGSNVEVVGYPTLDILKKSRKKNIGKRKTIIWAPHWTILKSEHNRSCFLDYYDYFLNLANNFQNELEIILRPHPLLKLTLYELDGWGKEKTDKYFEIWEKTNNLSISDGDYIDLFNNSDLIIHDSVGFLSEYLVTGNPAIFTKREIDISLLFNKFGEICLNAHYVCRNQQQLNTTLIDVLFNGNDSKKQMREKIVQKYLIINKDLSSNNILKIILNKIKWKN
ncbi:CDP-glycerol glycerophosphotransferase family protein [Flavobacteriaceae bacterium]|nr:CDP-glycerol glycerophosphotransferase family protein [Flavobacteriaceae bacterium]